MSRNKFLIIEDHDGGEPKYLEGVEQADGTIVFGGISVSGLGLTTAGVVDSLNKRFATDAELTNILLIAGNGAALHTLAGMLASLQAFIAPGTLEILLQGPSNVSLNVGAPNTQSILTVPAATHYRVTKVIATNTALTIAQFKIGQNAALDSIALAAAHAELAAPANATIFVPIKGNPDLGPGETVNVTETVAEGAAATADFYVYGYLL